jgi:hypothetical protein
MLAPRHRRSTVLTIAAAVALAIPLPSNAQIAGALKLITGGATFLGVISDSVSLFKEFDDKPNDDNPLWADSNSTPTIKFLATEHRFEMLVQQANDVSEFEDDENAQLTGIVTGPIHDKQGRVIGIGNLWEFSVTFEADLGSRTTDLDATGFVQHLFPPHIDQGEQPSGGAFLDFNLTVSKSCSGTFVCTWTQSTLTDTGTDHGVHADGKHEDTMPIASLSFVCCSTAFGDIDNFTFKVEAMHPIPEPSTAVLLLGGLGVIGFVARRRRCMGAEQKRLSCGGVPPRHC